MTALQELADEIMDDRARQAKRDRNARYYQEVVKPARQAARAEREAAGVPIRRRRRAIPSDTLVVRIDAPLKEQLRTEADGRGLTLSDVVKERLETPPLRIDPQAGHAAMYRAIIEGLDPHTFVSVVLGSYAAGKAKAKRPRAESERLLRLHLGDAVADRYAQHKRPIF